MLIWVVTAEGLKGVEHCVHGRPVIGKGCPDCRLESKEARGEAVRASYIRYLPELEEVSVDLARGDRAVWLWEGRFIAEREREELRRLPWFGGRRLKEALEWAALVVAAVCTVGGMLDHTSWRTLLWVAGGLACLGLSVWLRGREG